MFWVLADFLVWFFGLCRFVVLTLLSVCLGLFWVFNCFGFDVVVVFVVSAFRYLGWYRSKFLLIFLVSDGFGLFGVCFCVWVWVFVLDFACLILDLLILAFAVWLWFVLVCCFRPGLRYLACGGISAPFWMVEFGSFRVGFEF